MRIVLLAAFTFISTAVYSTDLLTAISYVESRHNDSATGDGGKAVGRYQIHKIYVDDVNRIAGTNYKYSDRLSAAKSKQMVIIYLRHYGLRYRRIHGVPPTAEVLARIHNGGPDGYRKAATEAYWVKVKKEMDKGVL